MSQQKIDGYWFAAGNRLPHGDNRLITIGETHHKQGEIVICYHGFHFSRDPFDALQYAPGALLYKVQVWGDVVEQKDKGCGRHRTYVDVRDATEMLRKFARLQALTCIDAWDAPLVVREYLTTGNPELRSAAWIAANGAAAECAARTALGNAAVSAAWSGAWDGAAECAARTALGNAVWSCVAQNAAKSAARQLFGQLVSELFDTEG